MVSAEAAKRVVLDFMERYVSDRLEGQHHALAHYLRQFPGFEEEVSRAFLAEEDATSDGVTAAVSPGDTATEGRLSNYVMGRELGRGGQGVVYLARERRLDRPVAIKVLHPAVGGDTHALVRMRREAEIASRLDHPGICVVHDHGRDGGSAWIAMRYVEGESLAQRLRREPGPVQDRAQQKNMLLLVERVARALEAAHQAGIVHRDVKPGNIMIDRGGNPVLLDFGLARDEGEPGVTLTATSAVLGTPAYISPEQLRRERLPLDGRADVYGLGVTLFRLLCGRVPFEGATFAAVARQITHEAPPRPRRCNPRLSRDLERVILTALHKERVDRYASAEALAEDLRRVREGQPVAARPLGVFRRLVRFGWRNPALFATASLLLMAVLGGLILTVMLLLSEQQLVRRLRQTSDIRLVRSLLREEDEHLWPVAPAVVATCDDWLGRTASVLGRRDQHREALRELRTRGQRREGAWSYEEEADAWIDDQLSELEVRYAALEARVRWVRERRDAAEGLARRSLEEAAEAWRTCARAVIESDLYAVDAFEPQLGLVPLGPDPETGLQEFWHVLSGERPRRSQDGEWQMTKETGIVLVLLPGGEVELGLEPLPKAEKAARFARMRFPFENEYGVFSVALEPFFLSKYEMTQAQWMHLNEGENPSYYRKGRTYDSRSPDRPMTLVHPVENMLWNDARAALHRHGLDLPTEVQWEYAARAGTETYWFTGNHPRSLEGYANVAGFETRPAARRGFRAAFDDGETGVAPVGAFLPNPFGLHDMLGNVWEWCRDAYVEKLTSVNPRPGDGLREVPGPRPSRCIRGGSFDQPIQYGRPGQRNFWPIERTNRELGIRPQRPVR